MSNGADGVRAAGCSKWPSSKAAASEEARRTLRYVEPLNDARTPLTDFFSILLETDGFDQRQLIRRQREPLALEIFFHMLLVRRAGEGLHADLLGKAEDELG